MPGRLSEEHQRKLGTVSMLTNKARDIMVTDAKASEALKGTTSNHPEFGGRGNAISLWLAYSSHTIIKLLMLLKEPLVLWGTLSLTEGTRHQTNMLVKGDVVRGISHPSSNRTRGIVDTSRGSVRWWIRLISRERLPTNQSATSSQRHLSMLGFKVMKCRRMLADDTSTSKLDRLEIVFVNEVRVSTA